MNPVPIPRFPRRLARVDGVVTIAALVLLVLSGGWGEPETPAKFSDQFAEGVGVDRQPFSKERPMATFITTIRFSQQGIKDVEHTTKRAATFKAEAKKLGVKLKDIYWTLGDNDGLLILESPDDETATAALLHLGAMGNVHTTTCRGFTAAEMDNIVSKMHGS